MAFSKAGCQSGKHRSIRMAAGALVYGRKKGGMVAPEKIAERYRQNDEKILPRAAWGGLKVPRIGDIVSICKTESARVDRAAPGLAEKRCDLDRYGDVGHGIGRKMRKILGFQTAVRSAAAVCGYCRCGRSCRTDKC